MNHACPSCRIILLRCSMHHGCSAVAVADVVASYCCCSMHLGCSAVAIADVVASYCCYPITDRGCRRRLANTLLLHHHVVATRCTVVVLLLPLPMLSHHILLLLDALTEVAEDGWCRQKSRLVSFQFKNTPHVLLDSTLLHIIHLHMNKNRAQYKQKMWYELIIYPIFRRTMAIQSISICPYQQTSL